MAKESAFRKVIFFFTIVLVAIRLFYQWKAKQHGGEAKIQPQGASLVLASAAAFTNIFFGLAHLFRPDVLRWSYVRYPAALRWLGAGLLAIGSSLLWAAHHALAENFSSLVVLREGQQLVQSGPYEKIRHPIYTAYLLNYVGGGLLSGNWVLSLIPATLYAGMIILRMPQEEALMQETFREEYAAYIERTGRLLPRRQKS